MLCKGPRSRYCRSVDPMVTVATTQLCFTAGKQPWVICEEWVWLCPNKTLFLDNEIWISCSFHMFQNMILLKKNVFLSPENGKTVLSSRALNKQAAGYTLLTSGWHSLENVPASLPGSSVEEPLSGLSRVTDCPPGRPKWGVLMMQASRNKMPGTDIPVKPRAKRVLFWHGHTWPSRSLDAQHSAEPSRCAGPPPADLNQTSHLVSRLGWACLFSFLCSAPNALAHVDGASQRLLTAQRNLCSPTRIYKLGTGRWPHSTKEKGPNLTEWKLCF